jgi:hypothetical protein
LLPEYDQSILALTSAFLSDVGDATLIFFFGNERDFRLIEDGDLAMGIAGRLLLRDARVIYMFTMVNCAGTNTDEHDAKRMGKNNEDTMQAHCFHAAQ